MASVLHGSARTTPRLRAEFQASQESTRSLAARYGLNPETVEKWRSRTTTADAQEESESIEVAASIINCRPTQSLLRTNKELSGRNIATSGEASCRH